MDNHHISRALPTSTIAVRTRLRDASPTISKQIEEAIQKSNNLGSSIREERRGSGGERRPARHSLSSSRYNQTGGSNSGSSAWRSGPPSPTKQQQRSSMYSPTMTNRNNDKSDGSMKVNTTNLSSHANLKLRARAASRAAATRGSESTPSSSGVVASSPAKTLETATTAPSSAMTKSSSHPNSISLTRRRLSQPMESSSPPPKHNIHNPRTTSSPQQHHYGNTNEGEMVCDYDASVTALYEMLESSKWDEARSQCRSHPVEARTWIVRRDKSHNIRWKLLPLHAAIIFQAPHQVISTLLDKYPDAAACPDDQGMLPLHLAFRHKQNDEDLIELLLVHYPQAVLMKDRRQRYALEHGRESKFSAKLMWLYADATVVGTESSKDDDGGRTITSLNSTLRADLEKQLRQEHEQELTMLRQDFDGQLQELQEKAAYETQHIKVVVDDERQTLIEQHREEVAELKGLLNQQSERESNETAHLRAEIDDLQNALDSANRQNDGLTVKYSKMEEFNRSLRKQLQSIMRDQLYIRDLATRQNNELDAARKMRAQIIQTLLQQEDTDGENDRMRSNKLVEVAENVRDRLHVLLRNDPSENTSPNEDGMVENSASCAVPPMKKLMAVNPFNTSRIEEDRGQSNQVDGFRNNEQTSTRKQGDAGGGGEGGGFFEERDAVFLAKIPELELRDANEALADLKSLGDEISGITEQSNY